MYHIYKINLDKQMTNYTPNTLTLLGSWKSEIGFFLEIEAIMHHSFRGWFRCLKKGPFHPFHKEIDGLVHFNGDDTIKLVFFCDATILDGPAHNYAFTCEVMCLTGKPNMQLHWLEYSGGPQKKTISEGLSILSRRYHKNDRVVDFSLEIFNN